MARWRGQSTAVPNVSQAGRLVLEAILNCSDWEIWQILTWYQTHAFSNANPRKPVL